MLVTTLHKENTMIQINLNLNTEQIRDIISNRPNYRLITIYYIFHI